MIEWIGKSKPKTDEVRIHLRLIENLMKRYRRIAVYAPPNSGKSNVMFKLIKKYENTEWNIYEGGEMFMDGSTWESREPYVYAIISTVQEGTTPPFDIFYILQYSTDYKESVSGVRFTDGSHRPIGEYMRHSQYFGHENKNLLGKKVRTWAALRKMVN
ncbi:MAG: hypothetical protein ACW99Q_14990 [Candidatus Kariarchaeaceae archaeon]|jgi:hypothetical protein